MVAVPSFAFLHGGGQGGWIWSETLAALAQQGDRRPAIAFDLPGCGARRGEDTAGLSTRQAAEAFVADLAASGLRDIILVGHSNAGTILPMAAEQRPDLIRRLVYISCVAPLPGRSTMETMDQEVGWADGGRLADDPLARQRGMFCNDMSTAEADAFVAKLGRDHWPTERSIAEQVDWRYDHLADLPATYVLCLRDRALPLASQKVFAERLRARDLVELDAGHQAMNTRPHAVAEILRHEAARDAG
jgi:pimeloyl-ACP methyl ester carboxylesterase